jgi:hypothetical protein
VLLGAAAGTQGVAAGMIWAHYYGRAGLGRVQGPATMVMISAAALAPLPLAAFRQLSGDYALGLLVMAAIPVACAVMTRFFDPERARRDAQTACPEEASLGQDISSAPPGRRAIPHPKALSVGLWLLCVPRAASEYEADRWPP